MHSRVGVLPVHERYGYPVVSSARAQGTRFVAAEAPFAEYRAVPPPEHEGRSSLVDVALDPSAQRESSLAIAFGRRGRAPGVDASLLYYDRAAQVGIKRRSANEYRRRRSFTHALFVRTAPPSAARAAASARSGKVEPANVLCVLRPSGRAALTKMKERLHV